MKYADLRICGDDHCTLYLNEGDELSFSANNCILAPHKHSFAYHGTPPFISSREMETGIMAFIKMRQFSQKRHEMKWRIWYDHAKYNKRLKRSLARNRIGVLVQRSRLDYSKICHGYRSRNNALRFDTSTRLNVRYSFGQRPWTRCHFVKRHYSYVTEIPFIALERRHLDFYTIGDVYQHMLEHIVNGHDVPEEAFEILDKISAEEMESDDE